MITGVIANSDKLETNLVTIVIYSKQLYISADFLCMCRIFLQIL
jgi:hypothetical protein